MDINPYISALNPPMKIHFFSHWEPNQNAARYELWLKGQDAIRRCSARGDAQADTPQCPDENCSLLV